MIARVEGPHVWCHHCREVSEHHWHVPAWCVPDQLLFASPLILARGGRIDGLKGSWTICPRCQGPAPMLDGVYSFTTEALQIVTASQYTYRRLAEVALAVDVARRQRSPQAAVRSVTRVDPTLGAHLKRFFEWQGASPLFAALTLLASVIVPLLNAHMDGQQVTEQDVIEMVDEAIDDSHRYDADPDAFRNAVADAVREAFEREKAQQSPPPPTEPPPTAIP